MIQTPVRGRITALYLLKPKAKDRGQLLKKLLGLKTSKTYNKSQLFKVGRMLTPCVPLNITVPTAPKRGLSLSTSVND